MGLDHTVEHGLHYAAGDSVVVVLVARVFDQSIRLWRQAGRVEKVRDVKAQRQLAAGAEFVVEIEIFEVLAGAVHAHQTYAVRFVDAFAERIEALGAGGNGSFRSY